MFEDLYDLDEDRVYFIDPSKIRRIDVEMIQGETWSATATKDSIFLPTQEWFLYQARHGGARNNLALARIEMILRSRGYMFNGEQRRCWQ